RGPPRPAKHPPDAARRPHAGPPPAPHPRPHARRPPPRPRGRRRPPRHAPHLLHARFAHHACPLLAQRSVRRRRQLTTHYSSLITLPGLGRPLVPRPPPEPARPAAARRRAGSAPDPPAAPALGRRHQ